MVLLCESVFHMVPSAVFFQGYLQEEKATEQRICGERVERSGGDWSMKSPATDQFNSSLESKEREDLGLCDLRTVPWELRPSPSQQLSPLQYTNFQSHLNWNWTSCFSILLSPRSFYVTGEKGGEGCTLIWWNGFRNETCPFTVLRGAVATKLYIPVYPTEVVCFWKGMSLDIG